jgi:toxin ParE1/3/4
MKISFSRNALGDLDHVLEYIGAHSGQGATNTKRRILEVIAPLKRFPRIGTPTDDPNIRMLVASPYPYIIFYEYDDTAKLVVIHHIRHARREREI